jgi:pre-rRNA-processing protein IPI1
LIITDVIKTIALDRALSDRGRRARSRPSPFATRLFSLTKLSTDTTGYDVGAATRATHAFRLARPPLDAATAVLDAFGGGRASRAAAAERDDGGAGVPAAAADLAALLFAAWDEATPALRDAGGGGADGGTHMDLLVKTKAMTEALVCTRLALRLVDRADARARGGVPGAAAGAAAGALAARVLGGGAFPAVAPAAHGAPERRALVAYNAAAAALLSAAADGVGAVLDARRAERAVAAERDDEGCAEDDGSGEDGSGEDDAEADASSESDAASDSDDAYGVPPYASSDASSDAIDARAADAASASVASYLAGALRGVALDAGPCGEAERTAEGDYGELLRAARRALARAPSVSRARSSAARRARGARAELVDAVGEVWTRAVVEGPPERRAACVSLLAAALPSAYALRDEKTETETFLTARAPGSPSPPPRGGSARPRARSGS